VRADFHLHTRRDKEFKYADEDNQFITKYIDALKAAGIQVGVITNHNKFDLGEFKALRSTAKKEDIYLLPGVELSVKDGSNGIHTLIVFKEDWIDNRENKDHINDFITVAFAGQTNYDTTNARSNHDLAETIRELDKFSLEYFLIFAHVDEKSGLFSALEGGRISELGNSELFLSRTAAFQKVRNASLREKVKSWFNGWYPAEVEGSDPKSIEDIGRGEKCFIKIGAFTFETIRYALSPKAERLFSSVEEKSHAWIKSSRFEGGILNGKNVLFSKNLNCLIGIRGSGKSAVLECIRYALNFKMPDSDDELDLKYKQELVRYALGSGGKIIIEIEDNNGRIFEIRRIINNQSDIYFEGQLKQGIGIPLKNPLFFGQKELVKRGKYAERELVERLIGDRLNTIRQDIEMQSRKVIESLVNFEKFKDLDVLQNEYENKKKDAEFRIDLFRKYGVEEQLRRQVDFNNDVEHAKRIVETVKSSIKYFETFLNDQDIQFAALPGLNSKENETICSEFNAIFNKIREYPSNLRIELSELIKNSEVLKSKFDELNRKKETLKEEFAQIQRTLSEQLKQDTSANIRPDDFVRLNAELQRANLALDEIAKNRIRKISLHDEFIQQTRKLSDIWLQEYRILETEINKLNASQTALRIVPVYRGDKEAFYTRLRDAMRGSRLRESSLRDITNKYPDFIGIHESLDAICNSIDSGDIFRKFFNDAKSSLLAWQVPNYFTIEYHGKDLKEHSLGQRASALILFILSQRDNDVIIIDQPEDDLDNKTIFEDVIKLIRTLKRDIQFIFATHNANFPVLGDAEQVGTCTFSNNVEVIEAGCIDNPGTQEAIVTIMEGGKEAFARRKEIYHLWKQ
jgi:ABC-type cobalamin/Fe3+-siderophores transport system ATPase subunit